MAAARSAAARRLDDPRQAAPAHFELGAAHDVVGRFISARSRQSARGARALVFTAADDGDAVAAGVVAASRMKWSPPRSDHATVRPPRRGADFVLGGRLIRAASPEVIERIEGGVKANRPVRHGGAGEDRTNRRNGAVGSRMRSKAGLAHERVRSELDDAFISVEYAPAISRFAALHRRRLAGHVV